jgi:PAS domain S-box-containing protein
MPAQIENTAEEIKRLRRCNSDLVSILALPAMWSSSDPSLIVHTLLDALLGMLSLDLVYLRLADTIEGAPTEAIRIAPTLKEPQRTPSQTQEICKALNRFLEQDPQKWPELTRIAIEGEDISILPLRLGLHGEIGVIVAGSTRTDFPGQTEKLLLSVAANQASIGLQESLLLSQQKRVAVELDQRVAQRTAELAAANAELQLQVGLLQHLPSSAWTLKPDGTPDFVNQVWLEFSGQTLDFVRSHPEAWMTAVHPEDREMAARAFWEGVRSGKDFAFETRSLRAKDGTYRWHLQQAVVLRDAEGKVLKFVGTTTDIDDQKRAEEGLRARELTLRRVIDAIPTLSWCFLPEGSNEFLNKRWHEYTGFSPEESHGWGWKNALHPDDLPSLMEKRQALMAAGEPGEMEARLRRHDGVYRWFLIRIAPFRDENGKIVRWYGTSTDIEDRKRGEEALRDREQSLRLILDGIAGLVAIMSPAGEVEAANRQALGYFGKSVEEMKGWSTSDAVHTEDLPGVISAWRHSVETASPYDVDHRLRGADGVYRWFHARGLPLCSAEGRVLRWYVLLTDIDDRRRAEEQLLNAQSELARVTRVMTMGQLTASIAHEINQPLSGIITNASTCLRMLAADPLNVEGARETVRRTIRDGNRVSDVISRLRALFTKRSTTTESIDLNEATREVIALSVNELQKNRVILRSEFAQDLPLVIGDRVQLQQVILNLLRNASDAMSTIDDRPRDLLIQTKSDGNDRVLLSVTDVGVGFEPQAVGRLFEAFYTTKNEGMGVGLSVSRSIIERHHGHLSAVPNNGPGVTFSFSIPCMPEGLTSDNTDTNTPSVSDAA